MRNSLRLRLLAGTLVIVSVIWSLMIVFAWFETRREANDLFDANLAQTLSMLAATAGNDVDNDVIEHVPTEYSLDAAFQIWTSDKRLLAHSASSPESPLSEIETGYSDTPKWRVYSAWTKNGRFLIQVGESYETRNEVSNELAAHLLMPLAVALPLLAIALVILIRYTFAPLSALADSIGRRSPALLNPIPMVGTPFELQPILQQLNTLLGRVNRSLQQERNFTGDAAHEIRTPLAAIRAHAQVARASRDDAERNRALDNVVAALDRTTHLTDQLLVLARLDATSTVIKKTHSDMRVILAEALALATPAALVKQIDLELGDGPSLFANVEPALIAILLRNLIDNAVRYSPRDSRVIATLKQTDSVLQIVIEDQGPGIPADELMRVRDRFYRVAGSSETGSGLGLSIATRIAELHGGRLEFDNIGGSRGLRVIVGIPISDAGVEKSDSMLFN